ncbi:MAG: hypothetical protein JNJ58_11320 [Chitinophagaceae bacterium]|nr:hypothetical protein [Chitinophagaceae bacterium]
MAKFLFFPYANQLGSTIPSITLANQMRDQGHEVIYASRGKYTNVLVDKGFPVLPINEISYHQYRRHIDNNNVDFYEPGLIHHLIDKEIELIEQVQPDIIVSNNRPTIKITAQLMQKKLISIVIPSLSRHYGHKYYVPENHFLNKILPIDDVNKVMPEAMVRFAFLATMKHWARNFNKVLKEFQLPAVQDYLDLYEGDITLINQSYSLFPFKPLPDNYFFLEQNLNSTFGAPHDWAHELEEHRRAGRTVIFVSMGSSALKSYPLVMNAIKNLVQQNDRFVLVSNHVGLLNDGQRPERVYVEAFINSAQILPLADIVITHGGVNTLSECMTHRKIIIGVPEQGEQLWNLKYAEDMGIGKVVSKFKLEKNPRLLTDALQAVVNDPNYHARMESFMQNKLQEADLREQRENIAAAISRLLSH